MRRVSVFLSIFIVVGVAVSTTALAGRSVYTETKLMTSDGHSGDHFGGYYGDGVSVSGKFAIVGAPLADPNGVQSSGAAYIFHYDGHDWVEYQKLTSSDDWSHGVFGSSVSISGDTAIIGAHMAPGESYTQTGAAYIFQFDGTNWVEQQKLLASDGGLFDSFGRSVSLSGNYAIVGAYTSGPTGYVALSGSAYIFYYNGTNWVEQQKLTASDVDNSDYDDFGKTVSISGDYAIVGARLDDDQGYSSGSAYIFHNDGTSWVEEQKLLASDGDFGDLFGKSVAISGNYAVVGAIKGDGQVADSGSAYIFYHDGSRWVEQQKISASDGLISGFFGAAVSVSGESLVVGAYGNLREAVYLYRFDGNTWVESEKIVPNDLPSISNFGFAVSISADNTILVGDYRLYGRAAAYLYTDTSVRYSKREKGKKCYDGEDNDQDGLTDSADPDCGGEGKGKTWRSWEAKRIAPRP